LADTPGADYIAPKRLVTSAQAQTPASAVEKGQSLPLDSFSALNQSVQTLRQQGQLAEAIRQLISFEGTTSSAVFNYVEAAQSGYSTIAYNPSTHEVDTQATQAILTFIAGMNSITDYSKGFSDQLSMDMLVETCLLEVTTTAGLANELVLDKARLPKSINVIAYDTLTPKSNGAGGRYFVQNGSTGEINLNIPTFFVAEQHKFANKSMARSMMEPAVNNSWYYSEFTEDMRRSVKNQHGRMKVKLDVLKMIEIAPGEIKQDKDKLLAFLEQQRMAVKQQIEGVNPQDALVYYDTADLDLLRANGEKSDYVPLLQAIAGNLATSLKTSPSIVGLRADGSQSLSNTESLLFIKVAKSIQKPVETNLSRILTLALRLLGIDAYVEFRFDPIDLRPENELEAFKLLKQARILELLSVGLMSDDQAAYELQLWGRPAGAPNLSGTNFYKGSNAPDPSKASPNNGAQEKAITSKQPTKAGGKSQ